jgi:hypothetical protein
VSRAETLALPANATLTWDRWDGKGREKKNRPGKCASRAARPAKPSERKGDIMGWHYTQIVPRDRNVYALIIND